MSKKYILVIETLTKSGSLSLFSEEMKEIDVYIGNDGNKMSADIIGMIGDLLNRNQVKLKQISSIVVSNGPGSFTGLRVGWAVVKGLAKGLNISFYSVMLLDALSEHLICGKTPDFTFVSIGVGKVACKNANFNLTEVFLNKDFLNEITKFPDKTYVTLRSTYNLLQNDLSENENTYYASDNVSFLTGESFRKGKTQINEIKYFG